MKRSLHRLFSLLLSLALLLSLLPGGVIAHARPQPEAEGDLMAFSQQVTALLQQEDLQQIALLADEEDAGFATGRLVLKATSAPDPLDAVEMISGFRDLYVLQFASAAAARAAWNYYRTCPQVTWAEADLWVTCDSVGEPRPADPSAVLLNQEYVYHLSDGYYQTDVNAYLDWLKAQSAVEDLPRLTVAVIDSGLYQQHELFENRIAPGGYDFVQGDNDPGDENGHGTHVSGTVVDGTLDNVSILPIRVLDEDGSGSSLNVCLGIYYAIQQGADVINMSLGGTGVSHMTQEAVSAAHDAGIPVVVAAGNDGHNASNHNPANCDDVITVGASELYYDWWEEREIFHLAYFSNYGEHVDLYAPGVDIFSAYLPSDWGDYTLMNGTSMATPHVAAAAALLLSYDPTYTPDEIELRLKQAATIPVYDGVETILNFPDLIPGTQLIVTVSHDYFFACPGQQLQLEAAAAGAVTWSSSDYNVATVTTDGLVTCLKEGHAYITATYGGESALCQVQVQPLELWMDPVTLYPGGTLYLECFTNCDPAPQLTWEIGPEGDGLLTFCNYTEDLFDYVPTGTTAYLQAAMDITQPAEVTVTASCGDVSTQTTVTILLPETDWYDPDRDTFSITTEEELWELSQVLQLGDVNALEGKTVLLENDLTLTRYWTPFDSFAGIFDGQGHTISNMTVYGDNYLGLFASLEPTAEVCNLTLKDVAIYAHDDKDYVKAGGIAGVSMGIIENCHVSGEIYGRYQVGGIVGYLSYDDDDPMPMVMECTSSAQVYGLAQVGGIVGAGDGIIADCESTAQLDCSEEMGGIAGAFDGTIASCVSRVNLTGGAAMGGIVGASYGTVMFCECYGTISGNLNVGGITGYYAGSDEGAMITDCFNYAAVNGFEQVGGIVGRSYRGTVQFCENLGDVSVAISNGGGICGYADENGYFFDSCVNRGAVTGEPFSAGVGGIVGYALLNLRNCVNYGPVTVSACSNNVGGIAGAAISYYEEQLINCINLGDITADQNSCEIGGICGYMEMDVHNCLSLGKVDAASGCANVGSLVGWQPYTYCSIRNSYAVDLPLEGSGETELYDCAQVNGKTLKTKNSITVNGYTGTDVLTLLNRYVHADYYPTSMWAMIHNLCFWRIEEGQWLPSAAVETAEGDLSVVQAYPMDMELWQFLLCGYCDNGQQAGLQFAAPQAQGYLITAPEVSGLDGDDFTILLVDETFTPLMEALR